MAKRTQDETFGGGCVEEVAAGAEVGAHGLDLDNGRRVGQLVAAVEDQVEEPCHGKHTGLPSLCLDLGERAQNSNFSGSRQKRGDIICGTLRL